ncbi:hypothetical protein [Paenibacillus naphthalenovorans]|uniref:Phage integrase n=1 Tax=Paenibacillus naphthalenovorans TaxID=162209 RepID=A0A0U2IMA0_9BACL|nr:hypothetical protein [Paenibacillus naphthalenovorans]ALS22315.1 phage integrase [Paenibacillus naphthalenovorans]
MKANIYGFEVEGTPQEVIEFKKLIETQPKQTYTYTASPYLYKPYISDNPIKWSENTCSTQS